MEVPTSVLISYSTLAEDPVNSPHGYSGIAITRDLVVTHGSLLAPILARSYQLSDFISSLTPGKLTPFRLPAKWLEESTLVVYRDITASGSSQTAGSRTEKTSGKLVAIWKCSLLKETFETSFRNWSFNNSEKFHRLLLPVFLAIECESWSSAGGEEIEGKEEEVEARLGRALSLLAEQTARCNLIKGTPVEIIATPFGNPLFVGSVAQGVVGNLFGTDGCLILMDANALPGCEGGPVYIIADRDRRAICGMVIASLSWCRKEWVDYTFAVNFHPSLNRILRIQDDPSRLSLRRFDIDAVAMLEESVTVVRCGANWGTAIFIDERTGVFLTCAHVVAGAPEMDIELIARTGTPEWSSNARLVYKTPESMPYDIAVLKVDPERRLPSLRPIELADEPARKGEQVLSIGFPFSSRNNATLSSGVVSKNLSCMLQTSCCAQSGASGGPIVRRGNHEMLGMLVCNAVSSSGSILYPRLSMAVPVTVLKEPLTSYIRTTDPTTLEVLTVNDAAVKEIWELRPSLQSNL